MQSPQSLNQPLMHLLISKTPLRLSLGGGGTDLPHFYQKHGAHLITTAIQKYVYVFAKRWFENGIRISYSKTELVSSVEEIQHPIVRQVLTMFGPRKQIEIVSMADLPARSGMGTSASFTVGLLNAIHSVNRTSLDTQTLAEMAFKIQTQILGEAGGKQDQYAAAFGGIMSLDIDRNGQVTARELSIKDEVIEELENCLICFYTGIQRESSKIQKGVVNRSGTSPGSGPNVEEILHQTKSISFDVQKALERGNVNELGPLLHTHWLAKRSLSKSISNGVLDALYKKGLMAGASGGKVIGAGGGGFFIFCCENGKKNGLRKELANAGLKEVKIRFDFQGSRVVANI
jgi:D-glycero-alpha-D-manno-heptose-7-phosphate kinase